MTEATDGNERIAQLEAALAVAEAALADIGDADREPGDDVAWCEARAAVALVPVRAALGIGQSAGSDAAVDALVDVTTHRDSWRKAIETAREHAEVSPPDIDDRGYLEHELRAFDRTFVVLFRLARTRAVKPRISKAA
jgi:hypothetical protein